MCKYFRNDKIILLLQQIYSVPQNVFKHMEGRHEGDMATNACGKLCHFCADLCHRALSPVQTLTTLDALNRCEHDRKALNFLQYFISLSPPNSTVSSSSRCLQLFPVLLCEWISNKSSCFAYGWMDISHNSHKYRRNCISLILICQMHL